MTLFYAVCRQSLFGGKISQAQVNGMNAIMDFAGVHAKGEAGRKAANQNPVFLEGVAYMLATAYHETGGLMQPVRETFAANDEAAIANLERAYAGGRLPQVSTPYWRFDDQGKAWFGRGLVQLTFEKNYAALSKLIGHDLVFEPSLALRPDVAVKILVLGMRAGSFSKRGLRDYFGPQICDWHGARRIINGTDRAALVAGYGRSFLSALLAACIERQYA